MRISPYGYYCTDSITRLYLPSAGITGLTCQEEFHETNFRGRSASRRISIAFYYVGNLSVFLPRMAAHASHKAGIVSFDLTRMIQTLKDEKAWTGKELTVTFVPQHPIPPKGEKPREEKQGVWATVESIALVAK